MNETELLSYASNYAAGSVPIIDIAQAVNSAQAIQLIESTLLTLSTQLPAQLQQRTVDLNAGHLLLSRGVLSKIHLQLRKHGFRLNAVYSTVPQTQQAALDEGFFVREAPKKPVQSEASIRQEIQRPEPQQTTTVKTVSLPPSPVHGEKIDLPQFSGKQVSSVPAPAKTGLPPVLTPAAKLPEPEPLQLQSAGSAALDPLNPIGLKHAAIKSELAALEAEFENTMPSLSELSSLSGLEPLDPATDNLPTLLVKQTLRSGQVLRYEGHILIIGDAHAGSEISAGGDIIVWGEIRGIAHAGCAYGNHPANNRAEIRAMKIEALQLRIGDFIARRPDRIFYHKSQNNQLPSPEIAKVSEGEIRIFKEQQI